MRLLRKPPSPIAVYLLCTLDRVEYVAPHRVLTRDLAKADVVIAFRTDGEVSVLKSRFA